MKVRISFKNLLHDFMISSYIRTFLGLKASLTVFGSANGAIVTIRIDLFEYFFIKINPIFLQTYSTTFLFAAAVDTGLILPTVLV